MHPEEKKDDVELTPEDVVGVLQSRGWEAEIIKQSDFPADELIPTKSTGLFKCVDGRLSPYGYEKMNGPKVLGGVYGIAATRGVTTTDGLCQIVNEVKEHYVPSCHGDHLNECKSDGCGFFKLWRNGKLDGCPKPEYDSSTGKDHVEKNGGVYGNVEDKHTEKCVAINFVPNMTLAPTIDKEDGKQKYFIVDAWICEKFNLDVPKYLTMAASTVEQLNGPKIAKLIVP